MASKQKHKLSTDAVAVIGLGRFGESLALELAASGTEVLGIDTDEQNVQRLSGVLTHVVVADGTDEDAMRQLGVDEFRRAVVGMGADLESSILTVSVLVALGVHDVWAKAISAAHKRILEQLGCHHVVRPEHDTGRRVAHLVAGRMLDYIELDDGYAIVKMRAPAAITGKTLQEAHLRSTYEITVVGVKRTNQAFTYADPSTVVERGDLIIVSGNRGDVEKFAELNGPG